MKKLLCVLFAVMFVSSSAFAAPPRGTPSVHQNSKGWLVTCPASGGTINVVATGVTRTGVSFGSKSYTSTTDRAVQLPASAICRPVTKVNVTCFIVSGNKIQSHSQTVSVTPPASCHHS